MSYPWLNFKARFLLRTFSRLVRKCDAYFKISIKEFICQFNIKITIIIFPVLLAFALRGDLQEDNTCV
jgi:hypothetical protein